MLTNDGDADGVSRDESFLFFLFPTDRRTSPHQMMQGVRQAAWIGAERGRRRTRLHGGANASTDDGSRGSSPPPTYEEAVRAASAMEAAATAATLEAPFVPPRYLAPSEGRNSIIYQQLPPLYDTTRLYLVDNKSADIAQLNFQSDHSDFVTSVVQNADFTPLEAATQTINLDDRSRWGGELRTVLHTNMPNVNNYLYSCSFRARLMTAWDATSQKAEYQWFTLTLPEGNFTIPRVIDLMNEAVVQNYLAVGRQHGVREDQIGVKIDSRHFKLGYDPETQLVMPGVYTYEAVHPDIVLLPGCAVDFSESRLNNLLGWRKRLPYQPGFVIAYEDLEGGNIPALLDVAKYEANPSQIVPLEKDEKNRSYHVGEDPEAGANATAYRSLYLAYNYGGGNGDMPEPPVDFDPSAQGAAFGKTASARQKFLLTTPDVTCGAEQVYWSLPDMMEAPVTFRESAKTVPHLPVVATELLPLRSLVGINSQPAYSQSVNQNTSQTMVFNRFPENQILIRPPAPEVVQVAHNVPSLSNHGTLPLKNSIAGAQRVVVSDARRRTLPYVYKSLGVVAPRVLSSRTF